MLSGKIVRWNRNGSASIQGKAARHDKSYQSPRSKRKAEQRRSFQFAHFSWLICTCGLGSFSSLVCQRNKAELNLLMQYYFWTLKTYIYIIIRLYWNLPSDVTSCTRGKSLSLPLCGQGSSEPHRSTSQLKFFSSHPSVPLSHPGIRSSDLTQVPFATSVKWLISTFVMWQLSQF